MGRKAIASSIVKHIWMTEEQQAIMKRLLWQTWEYIGHDMMAALEEDGKYSISRNDLIEVILDADHVAMVARKPEEKEALKAFELMPYKERIAFAKTRFTAARYS